LISFEVLRDPFLETLINPLCGSISAIVLLSPFRFSLYRHALPYAWVIPRPSLAAGMV